MVVDPKILMKNYACDNHLCDVSIPQVLYISIYIYISIWKHHYYCCTCYREVPRKLHYVKKQANVKVHFEGGDPVSLIYD